MRTVTKWVDKINNTEGTSQTIFDLCFNPDGSQLIIAGGNHVLVYDASNGTLIQLLKGHKDNVLCVSYAKNGEKFASGSADKTVIIWSNKLEGLLKYSHGEAIQCIAFNPVSHQLVSCALSDFAFWSSEQKSVQKHKCSTRIVSCAWTNDGQYLAIGHYNGIISIRNKLGEEKGRIEKSNDISIMSLAWTSYKDEQNDILCVADWNRTMSFYTLGGKIIGKERNLSFQVFKLKYFLNGDFILAAGMNKCCTLFTRQGIKLGTIGEQLNSWVWCCDAHPNGNYVVLGCDDGTIIYYQLIFNVVHGLYKDRYAFREHMTDIIIQHLITEQKVRIKCRDLIKKIAIYKNRLAVQLPERVVIYELYSDDANDMHYRAKEKITQKLECTLLVVCSEHLIICKEKTLQSMFFSGTKEKEWNFESSIRYIKIIDGPPGREGILLGLKNGEVWEVHLDNIYPLLKVTVNDGVRCLDLSLNKLMVAVVDEAGVCQVFNIKSGELCYKENHTNSVAFNSSYENMMAFSGNNSLSLKVLDFPAHRQKLNGFVVGFSGSKVFCLNGSNINSLELPLSTPMYQYISRKSFAEAYKIACLGVTQGDWEELAYTALESLDLEIAKMAFIRLQKYSQLELIQEIKECQDKQSCNADSLIGDIFAHRGKLKEAAKMYQKCGEEYKALNMYTNIRMFNEAQEYLDCSDNASLIRQKADWAKHVNESKAAAEMYISIGDVSKAIEIYGEKGWIDDLIELGRRLTKSDKDSLKLIADHLKKLNQSVYAAEIYRKLGDSEALLLLYIETNEWSNAFNFVQKKPEYNSLVYVPYAQWLAEHDKFLEAQKAFYKAGYRNEAFRVLKQLTEIAISEKRYEDASHYHWIMSRQYLDLLVIKEHDTILYEQFRATEKLSRIYYVYNTLYRYVNEPFTSTLPEALFNLSRYVFIELHDKLPKGVSLFVILYSLSKQANTLGANKLTKQLLHKVQTLKVPKKFEERMEISSIVAKSKSYNDLEALLPMCYRCSTYNPLIYPNNHCANCGQKFLYSNVNFEILPLVEFELIDGISDEEAVSLIEAPFKEDLKSNLKEFGEQENIENMKNQYFEVKRDYLLDKFDRLQLSLMDSSTLVLKKWKHPLRYQFFQNVLPNVQVAICKVCFNVFHIEDFELLLIQHEKCPFCRSSQNMVDEGEHTQNKTES